MLDAGTHHNAASRACRDTDFGEQNLAGGGEEIASAEGVEQIAVVVEFGEGRQFHNIDGYFLGSPASGFAAVEGLLAAGEGAALLQRHRGDQGICQGESPALLRPLPLEPARDLGHSGRYVMTFERVQEGFGSLFLFGTHAGVDFGKVERGSRQSVSATEETLRASLK